MAKQVVDPWLVNEDGSPDPFAGNIDFSLRPEDAIDPDEPITPALNPEVIATTPTPDPQPEPVAPLVVEDDQPEVLSVEGGSVTLEKDKGQWKGTLTSDTGGQPQVYWGKNKNELLLNVMKAQLNATKKIRELNAKVKFGAAPAKPQPTVTVPAQRDLTADEITEIKLQLEANPHLALQTWFQKATGLSVNDLVKLAQKGANADLNLSMESQTSEFLQRNPDYYPDSNYANYTSIVRWLYKFKLGKSTGKTPEEITEASRELGSSGNWTVENLEEAFRDLSEDGLMIQAPKASQPATPVTVPQEPAQPAPRPDGRIVRTETRPRAALGIGRSDVTPATTPETPKAPSAEDFDSMSDTEIAEALKAVRRHRIQSRRSN